MGNLEDFCDMMQNLEATIKPNCREVSWELWLCAEEQGFVKFNFRGR